MSETKEMLKVENGVVKANAEIFIIPNSACLVSDYFSENTQKRYAEHSEKVMDLNGLTFDIDHDKLAQFWICSDDLNTENLCRHGAVVLSEDGKESYLFSSDNEMLPASLFDGKKEGDVFEVNLPASIRAEDALIGEVELTKITLCLTMKLNQTSYRYRNHGNFEEVLQKVTR